jgi:YggT family protein
VDSALTYLATLTYWALTIYEWIVIIAILLSWVAPDPRNPIVTFLNSMTVPFWNWLRAYLPSHLSLFAAYVSLLVIWFLKIFLPGSIRSAASLAGELIGPADFAVQVGGYFFLGIADVLRNFLFFLIFLLLIWFFLTLVNPSVNNPIVRTIYFLVDPFITPVQRRLPRSRIDLSPLIVAGIFFLISVFVVTPFAGYAWQLAHYSEPIPATRATF